MKSLGIMIVLATAMLGVGTATVQATVEECPSYCSPVNNNYGPACASITAKSGKSYWTFSSLCELYKQRCYNQRFGLPAIEFVSDGSCSSSVKKTNECQIICSPENNKLGSVCASVGGSFRTYPNLCVMLKEKCTNERSGQPIVKYEKDGSCSIPVRSNGMERTPQAIEHVQRQELVQMFEDPTKNDAQVLEDPRKQD